MNDDFDHVPLETRIYDGDRAREVLENPAFERAFSTVEAALIERWKDSPARDHEGREKLWDYLYALRQVQAALRNVMETGTLAKKDLEHKNSLARRIKEALY